MAPSLSTPARASCTSTSASASAKQRYSSKLFHPVTIANGRITLSHRIVMAPMTRNRGAPLNLTTPNRLWTPDSLAATYYAQRTTPGGLIITEGIPPNLEGNGVPGVPGLFHPLQIPGWRAITDSVHARRGYIYAQIWRAGRCTLPHFTGCPAALSASATPFEGNDEARYAPPDATGNPGSGPRVRYRDFPPAEMKIPQIKKTVADFVATARRAMHECGFDGVEVHCGNGYLVEQFLSTNINKRTDDYGGSVEGYCRFGLELIESLAEAVGGSNVAVRLTPFGLFNQARGERRLEICSHFCRELKARVPDLSYIHFIEPRYEQIIDAATKKSYLSSLGIPHISLAPFRTIMGSTTFISAGGWDDTNVWGLVESGIYDAIAIGRYFTSNPDLVERMRKGEPLTEYDRSRFYLEPFAERERGYVDYELSSTAVECNQVDLVNGEPVTV